MAHLKKLKILEILKENRIKYIPKDLLKSPQKIFNLILMVLALIN